MRYRTQQLSTKFANKQRAENVERKNIKIIQSYMYFIIVQIR